MNDRTPAEIAKVTETARKIDHVAAKIAADTIASLSIFGRPSFKAIVLGAVVRKLMEKQLEWEGMKDG
jgi:hypothetical protein